MFFHHSSRAKTLSALALLLIVISIPLSLHLASRSADIRDHAQVAQLDQGFKTGANTYTQGHEPCTNGSTADQDIRYTGEALIGRVRQWVYWYDAQPHEGDPYYWTPYNCLFTKFQNARIIPLAVMVGTPWWASEYRQVYGANRLPPMKKVENVPIQVTKDVDIPLPPSITAPLDFYTIVSDKPVMPFTGVTNDDNLYVLDPWEDPNNPASGHYIVDYQAGQIRFSPGVPVGTIVYLSYLDAGETFPSCCYNHPNVPFIVTEQSQQNFQPIPATQTNPIRPRSDGYKLASGSMKVTTEPIYVEYDGKNAADPIVDYGIDYKIHPVIHFTGLGKASGTVYVTAYVLNSGQGSPWYTYLQSFANTFNGKVEAVSIWNEAAGNGEFFWAAKHNIETYAQFLHDSAQAIRSQSSMKILDGWEEHHRNDDPSTNSFQLLARLNQLGWSSDIDIVSYHAYPANPEVLTYALGDLQQAVGGRETWLTEFGWYTRNDGDQQDLIKQANYLTRALAITSNYPFIKKAFWFALDGYDGPNKTGPNWGLISDSTYTSSGDRLKKWSFYAMKAFNEQTNGLAPQGRITFANMSGYPDKTYGYKFSGVGKDTYILWTEDNVISTVQLPLNGTPQLLNTYGVSQTTPQVANNVLSLSLSEVPVYLVVTQASALPSPTQTPTPTAIPTPGEPGFCIPFPGITCPTSTPLSPTPTPILPTGTPTPTQAFCIPFPGFACPTPFLSPTAIPRATPTAQPTRPPRATPTPLPAFGNLSATLSRTQARFDFSYSGTTQLYRVDVSLDPKMNISVVSDFGAGIISPILVNNANQKLKGYACGQTIYWRVTTIDRTIQSPTQSDDIICPPTPTIPIPTATPGVPQCGPGERFCQPFSILPAQCWPSFLCPNK